MAPRGGGRNLNVHSRAAFRGRGGYRGRGTSRGSGRGVSSSSAGGSGSRGPNGAPDAPPALERGDDGTRQEERFEEVAVRDSVDRKQGFDRYDDKKEIEGWLVNMHPVRAALRIKPCY
jgi:DNA polymerase epsilon subunit 1